MKRLFLSFSVTRDVEGRHFTRRLLERLKDHSIDPWVYESPQGQIKTGASIADTCRQKIEESDVFVVWISDEALKSDYVDMEVSHALWESGRRPLPIVPLVSTSQLKSRWPPALAEATGFKGITLPPRPSDGIEMVVMHLCDLLQLDYLPPRPQSPRLPLRQRLVEELRLSQSRTAYDANDFATLLRKCDLVVEAMDRDDYSRARRMLDGILTDLELLYAVSTPYYPRIVYGAALLGEANAGRRAFDDAEQYFGALIAEQGDRLDANAFVGRANARLGLNRFEDALVDYHAAESYMEGPDAALFYNIVRARVLGGLAMDPTELRRRQAALVDGIVTRVPGDLAPLTSSASLAHAYMGNATAAVATWRQIGDMTVVFPELVVDVCHHLHEHARRRDAWGDLEDVLGILSHYIAERLDLSEAQLLPLRQLSARISFNYGERKEARHQLHVLIDRFPATPVLHLDAARLALDDDDVSAARPLCHRVVTFRDPSQCNPPLTSSEFNFALGHAFWLMGRRADAKESFRRSDYGPELWYGTTMPQEFGRLR